VKDNKDAVARRVASTGGQLEAVEEELRGWDPDNAKGNHLWINHFKTYGFHSPNESECVTI